MKARTLEAERAASIARQEARKPKQDRRRNRTKEREAARLRMEREAQAVEIPHATPPQYRPKIRTDIPEAGDRPTEQVLALSDTDFQKILVTRPAERLAMLRVFIEDELRKEKVRAGLGRRDNLRRKLGMIVERSRNAFA